GSFDSMSVVVLLDGDGVADAPALEWGRPEEFFAARDGLITKAEVRAVALGKLGLPRAGVVWDVGAGSGSVAVEVAALAPGLPVVAAERRADDVRRSEATAHANAPGATIRVVHGRDARPLP